MKEQFIHINKNGTKRYYKDREMTIRHREDGPAIEHTNGNKWWYVNGKFHREDGPAVEYANGNKWWYVNGKLHREDGPAMHTNGSKFWFINGKHHREDGPAIVFADGHKEWWINDKCLTEEEFNLRMSPTVELTLEEIAKKFGIPVDKLRIKD